MKLCLSAAVAALLAATAPTAAAAPSMTPDPEKRCYRDEESVNLLGAGFSPNGNVTIAKDGVPFNTTLLTDPTGGFVGALKLAQDTRQSRRTYTATDTTDPNLVATTRLTVSAVEVKVTPDSGAPGKVLRIGARGFTDGKTLYAHVVRKGKLLRNVRIGRLKGACSKLVVRKRLFRQKARLGTYRIQFDAKRRYRRRTEVKYAFEVIVSIGAQAASRIWRAAR
ncbi:MAG TPA: hypothetical protein VFQ12_05410 [Thermoleophilaceae bacterium]|nr:hypothetical protein [Thermoleophilaceae bacterium]